MHSVPSAQSVPSVPAVPSVQPFAAIVLAGGSGRRLGGVDKAEIDVGGSTLIRRALEAVRSASAVVVVGPARDVPHGVRVAQEQPAGGGPVAALAAGLLALTDASEADLVVVLACDMPFVDSAAVTSLVTALSHLPDADAALYTDADGRRQYLAAAYRRAPLRAAVDAHGDPAGGSMRRIVARLTVAEIPAHPDLTLDCDTWQDVERSRQILEDR